MTKRFLGLLGRGFRFGDGFVGRLGRGMGVRGVVLGAPPPRPVSPREL